MDEETDHDDGLVERLDGAISRIWGLLGRLDLGETLGREEERVLRRLSRRWRRVLRSARNQEALTKFEARLRRHGL